jgi:CCR4-NOT complex subunit CAF16
MSKAYEGDEQFTINCTGLDFAFKEGGENVLEGIDLQLEKGSRCLLVGANGGEYLVMSREPRLALIRSNSAGKSTLLRILAGKRLTKTRSCRILGQDVFMNPPGVSYARAIFQL